MPVSAAGRENSSSRLYELVFAFSDDEYRTRGVPYDPLGGTAHEHVFEAGMAMSRDDDEIGLTIAGNVGDYFKGRAYADKHFFQELWSDRVFANASNSFFMGPIGKPSPIGT